MRFVLHDQNLDRNGKASVFISHHKYRNIGVGRFRILGGQGLEFGGGGGGARGGQIPSRHMTS